ncbi:MAG: diaminopimelate decarboxylase family protein [Candidatus Hodarchaeota archaeon]
MEIEEWGYSINNKGHLEVDGCDIVAAAKEFGTPLHIVSKKKLIENYRAIREAFKDNYPTTEIFYSYKTNCVSGILTILHNENAGAEVISPYELWLAFKLRVPPDKIVYNGVDKDSKSLEMAVKKGIRLINIDSIDEIQKISTIAEKLGVSANVGVRVCPKVGWNAQFGLTIESGDAFLAFQRIKNHRNLLPKGIHVHIGTMVTKYDTYQKAVNDLLHFLLILKSKLNLTIDYLDLGGGFSIPTVREISGVEARIFSTLKLPIKQPRKRSCHPIDSFAQNIAEHIKKFCQKHDLPRPCLFLEPGRYISSNAQILLLSVKAIKEKNPKIAITDGGRANITFPTSCEYHEIFVANRMHSERKCNYFLAGRTCTPSDWIYQCKKLPLLSQGDVISIMDSGAYFTSFSNNFAFPRPPIILIDNGTYIILRERETFENMIINDNVAESNL